MFVFFTFEWFHHAPIRSHDKNIWGLRSLITQKSKMSWDCLISAFQLLGTRFSFLKELDVEVFSFTIFSPMRPNILQENRYEGSVVSRDECRQLIARGRQRRRRACWEKDEKWVSLSRKADWRGQTAITTRDFSRKCAWEDFISWNMMKSCPCKRNDQSCQNGRHLLLQKSEKWF